MRFFQAISRDLLWLALIIGLFLLAPRVLWALDPTAAPLDAGHLSALLWGALRSTAALALLWGAVHLGFPTLWSYLDADKPLNFAKDFASLEPGGRVLALISTLGLLLLIITLCLVA
jgi:hypothetical protein